jgi:hypothetical protein
MAVSPNTDFTSGQILTAAQQNNFPRGVMGYAVSTANATVTTVADVTGMSVTFTAVANRLYRATFEGFVGTSASASLSQFFFTDASNVVNDSWYQNIPANEFNTLCLQHIFTIGAGSRTLKVRAEASAGTMTFYGTSSRQFSFIIEDLGPA